ncbi:MAG: hypothetical protein ACRDFB_01625 [Rhabdochlamydiaceae bacterium]
MNIYRVFRDGLETFELIVHDGVALKTVTATHTEIKRQVDTCGSSQQQISFSIRYVGNACFVERWENNPYHKNSSRNRLGFRKALNTSTGLEAFRKYASAIKEGHSDSDTVIEIYEMVKQYVENFEVVENAT